MANLINLNDFKKKKEIGEEFGRTRTPLYISHAKGTISGGNEENFGSRLQRIRTSLEKINGLMAELKELGERNDF